MATIEIIGEDDFRAGLEVMEEHELIAQVVMQHGICHMLQFFCARGTCPSKAFARCSSRWKRIARSQTRSPLSAGSICL